MKELAVDTLNNNQVIIARERSNRPMDKIIEDKNENEDKEYNKTCPFCRGNEEYIEEETSSSTKCGFVATNHIYQRGDEIYDCFITLSLINYLYWKGKVRYGSVLCK